MAEGKDPFENRVGKGENADYQQFLLLSVCVRNTGNFVSQSHPSTVLLQLY